MNIVLIGSGNIATHLGGTLAGLGNNITQIYSRTLAHAKRLAEVLSATAVDDLKQIDKTADLYLIAVSDSAIPAVIHQLPGNLPGLILHCSGATPMDILAKFDHYGVLYPVQSFTKEMDVDLRDTPLGIEANHNQAYTQLASITAKISSKTFPCSSSQRLAIHLAAVFANNFSNALFQVAYELLAQHQLSFDLIRPLIKETAEKVQLRSPEQTQTGPAVRNDKNTMDSHLKFITSHPDWQLIYQKISDLIAKTSGNNS